MAAGAVERVVAAGAVERVVVADVAVEDVVEKVKVTLVVVGRTAGSRPFGRRSAVLAERALYSVR